MELLINSPVPGSNTRHALLSGLFMSFDVLVNLGSKNSGKAFLNVPSVSQFYDPVNMAHLEAVDTCLRKLLFFWEAVWVVLIWLITVDWTLNNKQIKSIPFPRQA